MKMKKSDGDFQQPLKSAVNLAFKSAGLAAMCLAAACNAQEQDPASAAPVKLQPGLYEISVSHAVAGFSSDGEREAVHCVTAGAAPQFHFKLAEARFDFGHCRSVRGPRTGNAFSGELICLADQKMATGSNRFVYEGVIEDDYIEIEARMKLDAKIKPGASEEMSEAQLRLAMKALEKVKSVIEAERIGDCR